MMTDLKKLAKQWREANGYTDNLGVVVFYGSDVQGWCNALRDPDHWQPGCIAIDAFGLCYKTVGGDAKAGAAKWVLVDGF